MIDVVTSVIRQGMIALSHQSNEWMIPVVAQAPKRFPHPSFKDIHLSLTEKIKLNTPSLIVLHLYAKKMLSLDPRVLGYYFQYQKCMFPPKVIQLILLPPILRQQLLCTALPTKPATALRMVEGGKDANWRFIFMDFFGLLGREGC